MASLALAPPLLASLFTINRASVFSHACLLSTPLLLVTGPSAVSSLLLLGVQFYAISNLPKTVAPLPRASLFYFGLRHAFFATNHACSFSALQYNAAFVTTDEFNFYTSGLLLAMNTFGWDVIGLLLIFGGDKDATIGGWYRWFQMLETLGACLSVSVHRRHLMIFAIFAPRFSFAVLFQVLCEAVAGGLELGRGNIRGRGQKVKK